MPGVGYFTQCCENRSFPAGTHRFCGKTVQSFLFSPKKSNFIQCRSPPKMMASVLFYLFFPFKITDVENAMAERPPRAPSGMAQMLLNATLLWNLHLQSSFQNGFFEQVLLLYRRMREVGVIPNASTFPSVIVSCANLSNIQLGEEIHAHALKFACDCDPFVGSSLVHMYSKFHQIDRAWKLLDRLPNRNVVSWTSLVQGYVEVGRPFEAIKAFEKMQLYDGFRPNAITLVSLIPAFVNLGKGESIHSCVIKLGMDSHSLVATSLVDMYLKYGSVKIAKLIFFSLHEKNNITWLVMVTGLARNGLLSESLSLVARLVCNQKMILDSDALVNLISVCADERDRGRGIWLHTYAIKMGMVLDAFVGTALLSMYALCGYLQTAHDVFDAIPEPSLVSWNAIMHPYSRLGLLEDVITLYQQLRSDGFSPDSTTVKNCLLAFASSFYYQRESKLGECFHCLVIKCGFFDSEIATANSLLDFYMKIGDIMSAESLFSCINGRRDLVSWNCLISGYVQNGYFRAATLVFSQMQSAGFVPDSFSLSSVLAACACIEEHLSGQSIHAYLMRRPNAYTTYVRWKPYVGTALVDMYAKCGDLRSAFYVFKDIRVKEHACWNAIITGCSQNGYALKALDLFRHYLISMEGSLLLESVVVTAISACGQLGTSKVGRCLHGFALGKGLESYTEVENAILSMYSKCGLVQDAEIHFMMMSKRDTTSWTIMIGGYGVSGRSRDAVFLFEEMLRDKRTGPNGITFLEVLWACSHGGLVKEGLSYFDQMRKMHQIKTMPEHYCCIVDLLGRAGYLYDAYLLVRSMELESDAAVWGALLNACKIYRELELAEIVWQELSRREGVDSGYQVLLSNAYAEVGCWEALSGMRNNESTVGKRNKVKALGWSRIEVAETL